MRKPVKRKNKIEADSKYGSLLISRFINYVMQNGKKSVARKIVYDALEKAEKELKKSALEVLDLMIEMAGPQVELKSKRVGGTNYQVPHEVRGERKIMLAYRWVIDAARKTTGKGMSEKLAQEIINACNNTGTAIKKKQDTHKMAEANKAFAHFAW